ncbi:DUF2075 domain-containing protein [Candidatus Saccharibacteria bacterium]|nr:DUF2075 domain-containing protein [Candidatus Saccharibacteria bacterium]
MILYEDTIERFQKDVMQNAIADRAAERYRTYYNRSPGDSEYRSWQYSLAILNNSFQYAQLKDNHIIVEYELPYASLRIDVLLFGRDTEDQDNVVILELKQWSNENVILAESEGNLIVNYGYFKGEMPHPSLQVQGYYFHLRDFIKIFSEKDAPRLSASVYAHNYSKKGASILLSDNFKAIVKEFPVFAKEDSIELARYLQARLRGGGGQLLYERFARSPIGPSKKLLGGPGTGKSVIALEVMGELMRQGRTVFHATGAAAFTKTLQKIVGTRASKLFKYFYAFNNQEPNSVEVIICDEAHRLRKDSSDFRVPAVYKSKDPQVDSIIKAAKLSVFFIDEYQIVRPNEIGSVKLVKEAAANVGIDPEDIEEFELTTQFRCSGSDAYLQWLDDALDIRPSDIARFDPKMEFKIFDDPQKMMAQIRRRNEEKTNSARIAAGFCWPWSKPNQDGLLVKDVKIGNFEMPWENKDMFWKWATDDSGMEQVGTVYTAQGFEFDYIGVIFGKDLVYRKNIGWIAQPENSHDSQAKRGNDQFARHLKHVYRVLLSRAHLGVYVYFMDKETEESFRTAIKGSV